MSFREMDKKLPPTIQKKWVRRDISNKKSTYIGLGIGFVGSPIMKALGADYFWLKLVALVAINALVQIYLSFHREWIEVDNKK